MAEGIDSQTENIIRHLREKVEPKGEASLYFLPEHAKEYIPVCTDLKNT